MVFVLSWVTISVGLGLDWVVRLNVRLELVTEVRFKGELSLTLEVPSYQKMLRG